MGIRLPNSILLKRMLIELIDAAGSGLKDPIHIAFLNTYFSSGVHDEWA